VKDDLFVMLCLTLLVGVVAAVPLTVLNRMFERAAPPSSSQATALTGDKQAVVLSVPVPAECDINECLPQLAVAPVILAPSNPAEWENDLQYLKGSLGVDVSQEQIEILRRQEAEPPKPIRLMPGSCGPASTGLACSINGQVLAARD
jgi:hypothetical protein